MFACAGEYPSLECICHGAEMKQKVKKRYGKKKRRKQS